MSSSDGRRVNDADNLRQDTNGDAATPDHSPVPEQDEGREKGVPEHHSTMKSKLKDQKQKIKTKANPPGGFDSTPIPSAPPGYTVKFTFHRAENLPTADIGTGAADPFLTATLSTSLPKRHKEDPDLFFRTRTIRRSLEPRWEEEWIVANVPSSGFRLKCRLYDEDWPDKDDRLGNVTIHVNSVNESWEGFALPGKVFEVKKRMGSKRAYALKAAASAFHKSVSMTPKLYISAVVLGKSDPPHGQLYTVGPTYYFKHFSPMIGRMTGIKVNKDETADAAEKHGKEKEPKAQKYDFQATEIQLAGPVPPKLYHRYVEFRPIIGLLFQSSGLRGHILNKALHHQHHRIYNFDRSTEWGTFEPCSEEASLKFLKMVHFDEGARLFTYIITLDGLIRFTETGKDFGIDLLSKHTMHSDAQIYIACSGEFLIKKLKKHHPTRSVSDIQQTAITGHEDESGPSTRDGPPAKPQDYQLFIDNDSGTYRPDKSVLPDLKQFLERNFPGINIVARASDDEEHQKMKDDQRNRRKKEARVRMVRNRSPTASSFSSSDISDLNDMELAGEAGRKSKKERAWELLEEPRRMKETLGKTLSTSHPHAGPSTSQTDGLRANDGGVEA
ncbi:hypothetical protein F5Y14DRAFT_442879 [Nemania sp. NC0429]|nr:hypothetical protein F5Y14DRAFT_442879 [Nemania sp. NC0429]